MRILLEGQTVARYGKIKDAGIDCIKADIEYNAARLTIYGETGEVLGLIYLPRSFLLAILGMLQD